MSGTFFERTEQLARRVGDGTLSGQVDVDQRYAHYQEAGEDLKHPRGGHARYLEGALHSGSRRLLGHVAEATLDVGGPAVGMVRAVGDLAGEVATGAPLLVGDLRASAATRVVDGGVTVYERPAVRGRLSDSELREKARRTRDIR